MSLFSPATDLPPSDVFCVAAWGKPKAGKTSFLVGSEAHKLSSWPLPIYLLNFNQGLLPLRSRISDAVWKALFNIDLVADAARLTDVQAQALLFRAEEAFDEAYRALRAEGTGTLAVDTASELNVLEQRALMADIRKKRKAEDHALTRYDYQEANASYWNLITRCKTGVNLVLLEHATELYDEKGKPLGLYRAQENTKTEGLVDVKVHMRVTEKPNEPPYFDSLIQLCRNEGKLRGLALPNLDYRMLYQMVHGKETPYECG